MDKRMLGLALGHLLFAMGAMLIIFTYAPIIYSEINYRITRVFKSQVEISSENIITQEEVETEDVSGIAPLQPISQEFAIIIPKIDVNAPIVENVSVVNETEYMNSLREGVAHAVGTPIPGEQGNIFLFAHSSLNFWQLGPYATVFNLLNKLDRGDIVILHYKGNIYEYSVMDNEIVPGWETRPFDAEYEDSVVTLITCDPPGTTINRRVVRAKLLNVVQKSEL